MNKLKDYLYPTVLVSGLALSYGALSARVSALETGTKELSVIRLDVAVIKEQVLTMRQLLEEVRREVRPR